MEFHTPHFREVSNLRPDSSGRILRFALTLTLIPARFPSRSGGNLKEGGEIQQEPVARKRIKTAWRTATGNPTVSHALVRCAVRWARRKNALDAPAPQPNRLSLPAPSARRTLLSRLLLRQGAPVHRSRRRPTRSTLRRRPPTRPVPTAVGNPHPARPVGRTLRPSRCRRGVYRSPVSRADELAGTGVNPLLKVPPASRGNRTRTQRGSPRAAGAKTEPPPQGSPCKQGEPRSVGSPRKRREPQGGGIS